MPDATLLRSHLLVRHLGGQPRESTIYWLLHMLRPTEPCILVSAYFSYSMDQTCKIFDILQGYVTHVRLPAHSKPSKIKKYIKPPGLVNTKPSGMSQVLHRLNVCEFLGEVGVPVPLHASLPQTCDATDPLDSQGWGLCADLSLPKLLGMSCTDVPVSCPYENPSEVPGRPAVCIC